jgi:DeoR/GlpR family transcriptional regulator of sugar metabolism
MLSRDRQRRIVDAVASSGAVSVQELAAHLAVSESTIRRDLRLLDRNGELERTFGGAVAANTVPARELAGVEGGVEVEEPYDLDAGPDVDERRRIATAAAALVRDGDVVLLDIGTTTTLLAAALKGRDITVITSNLGVLDQLRDDPAVRLVLLGGVLRRNFQTLVGSLTEQALREVSADVLFLSCTGVRSNGRVLDNMAVEVPIKLAMVEAAEKTVLLASAKKFPGTGNFRVCSLTEVDVLVTTAGAESATTQICRDAGGKVLIA